MVKIIWNVYKNVSGPQCDFYPILSRWSQLTCKRSLGLWVSRFSDFLAYLERRFICKQSLSGVCQIWGILLGVQTLRRRSKIDNSQGRAKHLIHKTMPLNCEAKQLNTAYLWRKINRTNNASAALILYSYEAFEIHGLKRIDHWN